MASNFFVHDKAICDSTNVGEGTRIWAFSHVMAGAKIGKHCNIGEHCFVENDVVLGDECVIKNSISIWDGITLENRVFLGPNVVLTNDYVPRAKVIPKVWYRTLLREGASVGANATLVCGITVGRYAMIGAGAVVTRDVPDYGLVYGNPARLHGFVCVCAERLHFSDGQASCECGRRYRQQQDGKAIDLLST